MKGILSGLAEVSRRGALGKGIAGEPEVEQWNS
jgi:hypothetical protein